MGVWNSGMVSHLSTTDENVGGTTGGGNKGGKCVLLNPSFGFFLTREDSLKSGLKQNKKMW